MLWLLSGPPVIACWISFVALIIWRSFLLTRHLCVLVRIWAGDEVGAPLGQFRPSSGVILLTVPRRCFFYGSFVLFLCCVVMLSCASVC